MHGSSTSPPPTRLTHSTSLCSLRTNATRYTLPLLVDCKTGQYFYAAKAFDALEKLDGTQEFWEGKRGACVGVYQRYMSGLESRENLEEVIQLLKSSDNSQIDVRLVY